MLLLLAALAAADQLVEGDALRVYYDGIGVWNDRSVGAGLQVLHGTSWVDWAYYGYPWQVMVVEYSVGGTSRLAYVNSNDGYTSWGETVEEDLSGDGWAVARHTFTNDELELVQVQGWAVDGRTMRVGYRFRNLGAEALTNVRLMFDVDPDPEGASGVYTTLNDAFDTDGDGLIDLALASASTAGWTLGFGACDPVLGDVGFISNWTSRIDADASIYDPGAVTNDDALAVNAALSAALAPGATAEVQFLVIAGDDGRAVQDAWAAAAPEWCGTCDDDGDGHEARPCGGDDCDDADADAHPGAPETWYDGVDGDCLGGDDYDQDGDGSRSDAHGGDDCVDTDAAVRPGAAEVWYDGVDQDCDGNDDDQDGDGWASDLVGGEDCDDLDPAISPDAPETWYDGVDQDCDGNDDDQDGDGVPVATDCDDTDPAVYPGAAGENGDGVDSDCDGLDDDVAAPAEDGEGLKVQGECGCATGAPQGGGGLLIGLLLLAARRRR